MSSKMLDLALVQFAPRKGDLTANLAALAGAFATLKRDRAGMADVVVFPETCLSGYFVEGGVRELALSADEALRLVNASAAKGAGKAHRPFDVIVGFYENDGGKLYNSALYATLGAKQKLHHVHRKMFLPTYGVFDEERFVSRGSSVAAFDLPYGRAP